MTAPSDVWAYIRVSSEQQADQGLPVAGQREAIESYCADRGYRITRYFIDEAVSGGTDRREQFQAMVELAANGRRPHGIVMWSWSRFSRNQNDALFYKALLRRHGVQILTIEDDIPHVDGFENILESLIHWKDEQYLKQLSQSSRRGQQTLARMGFLPGADASLPYGYRSVQEAHVINGQERLVRRVELDPETAPQMRLAFEMRLAGARYVDIHEATHVCANATQFGPLFRNTIYKGELKWGDTVIPVPAIVTPEEWQQVYDGLFKGKGGGHSRRKSSGYLLSGLARCAECGLPLTGQVMRRTYGLYRYYRCHHTGGCSICTFRSIPAEPLEKAVVNLVLDNVLTDERLEAYRKQLKERRRTETAASQAHLAGLERKRQETTSAIANLLSAIELSPANVHLASRLDEKSAELEEIEREIAQAHEVVDDLDHVPTKELTQLQQEVRAALLGDSVAHAREVLSRVVLEVLVEDRHTAKVRWRYPFV